MSSINVTCALKNPESSLSTINLRQRKYSAEFHHSTQFIWSLDLSDRPVRMRSCDDRPFEGQRVGVLTMLAERLLVESAMFIQRWPSFFCCPRTSLSETGCQCARFALQRKTTIIVITLARYALFQQF